MKVLVVDDDRSGRDILDRMLSRDGHQVIHASDGQRALVSLEDNPGIGLVITDVMMPNLDGRGLVRELRGRPEFAALPIIVVSGKVGIKAISEILELGAMRFMGKPVRHNELRSVIEQITRTTIAS